MVGEGSSGSAFPEGSGEIATTRGPHTKESLNAHWMPHSMTRDYCEMLLYTWVACSHRLAKKKPF